MVHSGTRRRASVRSPDQIGRNDEFALDTKRTTNRHVKVGYAHDRTWGTNCRTGQRELCSPPSVGSTNAGSSREQEMEWEMPGKGRLKGRIKATELKNRPV